MLASDAARAFSNRRWAKEDARHKTRGKWTGELNPSHALSAELKALLFAIARCPICSDDVHRCDVLHTHAITRPGLLCPSPNSFMPHGRVV
jgi:hypothetical protein